MGKPFFSGTGKKDDTTKEEEPVARRRSCSTDRDEMSVIRTMIFDLQEEKDKLKQANSHLGDELYKKQKHMDDLYSLVEQLQDLKADKDLVSEGFEFKADKREVDMKVGRDDFDHCMGLVDQSLRDLLQRLDGHVSISPHGYSLLFACVRVVQCSAMQRRAVLCCAVLYCTVLYCTVLCCAVPCCAVLCFAVLYCTVLCCAVLCCAVLCRAVPCRAVPCRAVPCRAVLCCAVTPRTLFGVLPCTFLTAPIRPVILSVRFYT